MTRDERHQWLGAVTTIVRNRWPKHLLFKGDHIWNVDVGCWQVWNGVFWVSICPGGGGGGKEGEPEISVGNALAGDTPADCDILDPGDGSGIAIALSIAPAGGAHIYVRRGIYTLVNTLLVPANIDIQGAGVGTVIRAPAGSLSVFITGSNIKIRGMIVEGIRVNPLLSFVTIKENTIQNSYANGIYVQNDCMRIVISDNIIQNSTIDGVRIEKSNYCSIKDNYVIDNAGHGVHLRNDSNYTSIQGDNIIRNNVGQGIMIAAVTEDRTIIIGAILQGNAVPQLTDNGNLTEKIHFEIV
jgi:parallel beta-helix repeat protein